MIKALLVGINDYPAKKLEGALNDVEDMMTYLKAREATILPPLKDSGATKGAIVAALNTLIEESQAGEGDHLLFYFAGHGAQIASADASEGDSLDEVLCTYGWSPGDLKTSLTDKEIAEIVQKMASRPKASLTLVFDACHSGGAAEILSGLKTRFHPSFAAADLEYQASRVGWRSTRYALPPNAMLIAACQDYETAKEDSFDLQFNGAFTRHWIWALGEAADGSVRAIIDNYVTPPLIERYKMHPKVDARGGLADRPFLG